MWQLSTNSPFGVTASQLTEQRAAEEQRARMARIKEAWLAYDGRGPKPFPVLDPTRPDDNTCVNWHETVVDTGTAFLMGAGVEFAVETEGDEEDSESNPTKDAQEEWLEAVWDAAGKDILLHNIATNGAVSGDAFVKIRYEPGNPLPRLINIDPATIYALWDMDDIERVVEYRIEWQGIDVTTGKAVNRRQVIARDVAPLAAWVITDYQQRPNSGIWDEVQSERWPYEWCPIVHIQNLPAPNEFYGKPDLTESLLHLQDRANYNLSNRARIDRFHAHPKTWGRGFTASQMDMGPEALTIIQSENGTLQNLEMQTDLVASRALFEDIERAYFSLAKVPQIATGRLEDVGALSGLAMQVLWGPLIKRTNVKRQLYGEGLEELNAHLMEIGGWPGVDVEVRFSDALPKDRAAEVTMAEQVYALGVSRETVLTDLGYNAEEEIAKRAEEDAARAELDSQVGDQMLQAFERGQTMRGRTMQGGQGGAQPDPDA